jgi:hypothetical protein
MCFPHIATTHSDRFFCNALAISGKPWQSHLWSDSWWSPCTLSLAHPGQSQFKPAHSSTWEVGKVSRGELGRIWGMEKQPECFFLARNSFWALCMGSHVRVDDPLSWHQVGRFMVKSLQELPNGTNNLVCLHCGTSRGLVVAHQLLFVV